MFSLGINSSFTFGLSALARNQADVASSLEKLSTGKRINRAGDDPSGMIAAENHKAEIYTLNKRLDAFAQQEGYLGAKEGGLSVISERLIELNGLIVQAANEAGTTDQEREALNVEIGSILGGIDQIARTTTFKGDTVLAEYTTANLEDDLSNLTEILAKDPSRAQEVAQDAVDSVARTRGALGARLNEIESEKSALGEQLINLTGSLSGIEDTDYAAEAAKLIRAQIKEQASIAAIDIGRQSARQVLGLLASATKFNETA